MMKIGGIEVTVERKRIKHTHLSVYPPDARVHVSAPEDLEESDIRSYLASRLSWIREQRTAILSQPRQTRREYVSGENIYCLGKRYRLRVEVEDRLTTERVLWGGKTLRLIVREGASAAHRGKIVASWQKAMLTDVLSRQVAKACAAFGIPDPSWRIVKMKARWGSCGREKKSLIFNSALALTPPRCIEYVVVHELSHLQVKDHSPSFVKLMDSRLPRWRDLRQELNAFISSPMEG